MTDDRTQRRVIAWRKWLRRGLLLIMGVWLIGIVVLMAVIHFVGQTDQAQPADVIIVLGAGLESAQSPGDILTRRAGHAADLWARGLAPVIICTGGVTSSIPQSEASGCAQVLREHDIPESAIILEERSRSTEENASYAQEIMAANGWQTAILVSDGFHMLRAHWLFQRVGLTIYNSPVSAAQIPFGEYALAVLREVGAFHWHVLKDALHLPFTYVSLG